MLAIRLMRTGKAHAPHYRIVVQEKRSKLNGKAVDQIGHYHPAQAEKLLVIDKERADYWLGKGAQPSDTVTNLLVKQGILDESRKIKRFYTPKPKDDAAEEKAPKVDDASSAPEGATETEETVAEETSEEIITEEAPAEEVATEETPAAEEPIAEEAAEEPAKEPAPEA